MKPIFMSTPFSAPRPPLRTLSPRRARKGAGGKFPGRERTPLAIALEDLLGDERRGHRRRPAGIKGEMGDDLADLALGDAVVERPLQMADKLPLAAERDQGCAGDQAAVALGQPRAFPDLAEQDPLAEVDQTRHHVADRLAGGRGLRLRHPFSPFPCRTVAAAATVARRLPPRPPREWRPTSRLRGNGSRGL